MGDLMVSTELEKIKDIEKKEKQDKKLALLEIGKFVVTVLEIICTGALSVKLFTIENSFNEQMLALQQTINNQMIVLEEQISNSVEVIKNVDMSSTVENTVNNYGALISETTGVDTLLRYAQNAYVFGDYEVLYKFIVWKN